MCVCGHVSFNPGLGKDVSVYPGWGLEKKPEMPFIPRLEKKLCIRRLRCTASTEGAACGGVGSLNPAWGLERKELE